jgi:hypothetical protein
MIFVLLMLGAFACSIASILSAHKMGIPNTHKADLLAGCLALMAMAFAIDGGLLR